MPLKRRPGSRLGPYEVGNALGAGGMGEVYRARDTRLDRDVALKFLPDLFSEDPERLARFEREAKTLAALNHPHIAQLYGLEESSGTRALVMELVEGEDLSKRIARGPLPVDEAVAIARQLADALEAAHEVGIVHRDLKPANIQLRSDGTVKVLDFGLAKALEAASDESLGAATLTSPVMTAPGGIIGTAAYMAPEQARGKPVDKRADIWAFGVVLYEMLTGTRLFEGETVADTIALVVTRTPELDALPRAIPRDVRVLLRRCIERDPRRRLRDIGDARLALEDASAGEAAATPLPAARWRALSLAAAAGLLVAAAAGGWWAGARRAPAERQWSTFAHLTDQAGEETTPAISPDGRSIAYASRARGTWDIYVQRIGGRTAIPVAADDARHESAPAFSPDGVSIAFHESDRDGGIFVAGATGESARRLTDFGFHPSWSPDGTSIVFGTEEVDDPYTRYSTSTLWTVGAGGGTPRKISDGDAIQPVWSPSGRRIAFWVNDSGQRDVMTVPADGGPRVPVTADVEADWSPAWSPDGRYLYFSSDRGGAMNIWRVAIDEASGRALGSPMPVTAGVHASSGFATLSKDGSALAFRSQVRTINPVAIPFDPAAERLGTPVRLIQGTGILTPASISHDGRWLLHTAQGARQDDVFVSRTDGSDLRRLTDDLPRERWPIWSPDGREVAFYSNRGGHFEIWGIKPDGSGLRRISEEPVDLHFPLFSPAGDRLIASAQSSPRAWITDPSRPWKPNNAQLLEGLELEDEWLIPNDWSPDGRRLVGPMMTRAGTTRGFGVYDLQTRRTTKVTDAGEGVRVAWLPDSRRVLVLDRGERILLFDVDSGRQRVLLERSGWRFWSNSPPIAPDGRTIFLGSLEVQSDVWMAR